MEGTRVVVGSSDGTGQYWFPGGGALDVGKGKDLRLAELLVGGENVPPDGHECQRYDLGRMRGVPTHPDLMAENVPMKELS